MHPKRGSNFSRATAARQVPPAGLFFVVLPIVVAVGVLWPAVVLSFVCLLAIFVLPLVWEIPALRHPVRDGLVVGTRAALVVGGSVGALWLALPLPAACLLAFPCTLAWLVVRARVVGRGRRAADPFAALPPRDREILAAWRAGRSVPDIAHQLGFAAKTVYNILSRYRRQFGPALVPDRSPAKQRDIPISAGNRSGN